MIQLDSAKPKNILALLVALAVGTSFFATADPENRPPSATDDTEMPVDIPDAALREAVEQELGKAPGDPITRREMATLQQYLGAHDVRQLTGIEYAVNLRHLDTRGGAIENLTPLASLTSLEVLQLDDNRIADLGPLADLTSLTRLSLTDNQILDLRPLEGLTLVIDISLRNNAISDLAPLVANHGLGCADWDREPAACPYDTRGDVVDLRGNPLDTTSNETHIPRLLRRGVDVLADAWEVYVDIPDAALREALKKAGLDRINRRNLWWRLEILKGSGVRNLAGIEHAARLRHLALTNGSIADLGGLTKLEYIDLSNNAISDVAPLVENDGLGAGDEVDLGSNVLGIAAYRTQIPMLVERGVRVHFTSPSEIPDLQLRRIVLGLTSQGDSLDELQRVVAENATIEDLTGLEGATDLRLLFLDGNSIKNITPLANISSLRALSLARNEVEDLSPLEGLLALYYLALDSNSLQEVPQLSSAVYFLYLADNHISDLTALGAYRVLWKLDISANLITSLAPLAVLRGLRYLHVADNQVTDIAPLHIEFLRELRMANNAVRDISPLLDGEELLLVDVRRNPLADSAVAVLQALRERSVTVLAGETVPYFPAAGDGRQGFVRVINRSDEDGHAFIEAVDDAGVRVAPVRFELRARRTVHFNSGDLENGNREKGIDGIGAPTAGDWRLSIISARDVEVLSYIRTGDGFVTAMHDVVADAVVPFFNPGSNRNQRSILRVVNTEADPAKWTTGGYDDGGQWRPMTKPMLVRPQHALTLTAEALENAHGMGDGHGKWWLRVRGFPWYAMSLLESPTGHLTNLSTAPNNATPLDVEGGGYRHRLPLVPSAGGDREGFVRVINRSRSEGEVAIEAVDDEGNRFGPVELALDARQTVHFNSNDLEAGNAGKGLFGGVGEGRGDWRLELTSTLDLQVLAYIRTSDGFLTSMHDLAPRMEDGDLWIPFFNPGSNRNQVSHLRLVNWGDVPARATITAIDDDGQTPGDAIRVTIPAHAARTFTAAELETGDADGLSGALGDGEGKWRLRVATEAEVSEFG